MQNPTQKFRQSSIVFEKLGILSSKLETLTSSNCHRVEYFWLKFCIRFYLALSKKGCLGFSLFDLHLELFAKIQHNLVSTRSLKLFSLINQDLSKIKNITNIFLQALLSRKRV